MFLDFSNPAGAPVPRSWAARAVTVFSRLVPVARRRAVSVALVDAKTSRRLNRTYRKVDAATDVLSFPPTPWPGQPPSLGEVIICYPVAVRQAKASNTSIRAELTALLIHGLAHLAGHDHDTPAQAQRMARFETNVLLAVQRER